jgi:hypothetical protein
MAAGLLQILQSAFSYWNGTDTGEIDLETDVPRLAEDTIPVRVAAEGTPGTEKTAEYFYRAHGAKKLVSAHLVPGDALTADDVDFKTVTVATASDTIAEIATTTGDSGDWVAGTPIDMGLEGVDLVDGDVLSLAITADGNGVATPEFCVVLVVREE